MIKVCSQNDRPASPEKNYSQLRNLPELAELAAAAAVAVAAAVASAAVAQCCCRFFRRSHYDGGITAHTHTIVIAKNPIFARKNPTQSVPPFSSPAIFDDFFAKKKNGI